MIEAFDKDLDGMSNIKSKWVGVYLDNDRRNILINITVILRTCFIRWCGRVV